MLSNCPSVSPPQKTPRSLINIGIARVFYSSESSRDNPALTTALRRRRLAFVQAYSAVPAAPAALDGEHTDLPGYGR